MDGEDRPAKSNNANRNILIIALLAIIIMGVCALIFLTSYLRSTEEASLIQQDTPSVPVNASEWNVLISDNFKDNTNQWFEGTSEEANITVTHTVTNGKYRWDATSHQDFVMKRILFDEPIHDFYATMEVQNTGQALAEYGIIFREDDNGNFYFFALTTFVNSCSILQYYNGEWTPLISWDGCPSFSPTAVNRISILVQGDSFIAFINDKIVGEARSDLIKGNNAGIAINLDDSGSTTVFEFDNLELRVP